MKALFLAAALLASTPAAAQLAPVTVDHFDLVQSRPVTRTRYEFVYRVTIRYGTPGSSSLPAQNLRAQVTSTAATTVISEGELTFGSAAVGAQITSTDTFSLVQDRTRPFDRSVLSFSFQDVPVLPSVQGMTQEQAVAALAACCGLSVYNFYRENDPVVPAGTVTRTDPSAGTPLSEVEQYGQYLNGLYLSTGPDHTSQFGITLASHDFWAAPGDRLGVRVQIDRAPGFTEPISLELEDPPSGYEGSPLSVGPAFPTPELSVLASSGLFVNSATELVLRATAAGQSVHIPFHVYTIPQSPRSGELIQSALASGAIDLETSYLYRMYSMMGDPRLPPQFAGRPVGDDSQLFRDIQAHEASLSSQTRALLHPFLVRPSDPDSIWSQPLASASFASARSAGSAPVAVAEPTVTILPDQNCPAAVQDPTWVYKRVRVDSVSLQPVQALLWVRCDPNHPDFSRLTMDVYFDTLSKVLGPMSQLMGAPLPDAGNQTFDPDGAIDIYVVPRWEIIQREQPRQSPDRRGFMRPIDMDQSPKSSGYIQVDDNNVLGANGEDEFVLIHELFHIFEAAHNIDIGNTWIEEACAQWAVTYFDAVVPLATRSASWVHKRSFDLFRRSSELALYDGDSATDGAYRSYIWFFYIQRVLGREQGAALVANLWRQLESESAYSEPGYPTNEDVDAALAGLFSFADNYPNFARLNVLTQDFLPGDPVPEGESYRGLDPGQFPLLPPFALDDLENDTPTSRHYIAYDYGAPNDSTDEPFDLRPLQTQYILIEIFGSAVHQVDITWEAASAQSSLTVDSVVRVRDGKFKVERVHTPTGITYCIPSGADDQALVGYLIFSNAGYLAPQEISQEKLTVTRRGTVTAACGCTNAPAGAKFCAEKLSRDDYDYNSVAEPTSINHYGQVAGFANDSVHHGTPVVWPRPDSLPISLLPYGEVRQGSATRITDDGQVAGVFYPLVYPPIAGSVELWPATLLSMITFPYPSYPPGSVLPYPSVPYVGLNNQGVIAYSASGHVYIRQYDSASEFDAGPGDGALDLNEYNHVLIREGDPAIPADPPHDTLWKSGVRTPLSFLAEALNDEDVVVGEVVNAGGLRSPVRWRNGALTFLELPTVAGVPPPPPPGWLPPGIMRSAYATDINNRGEVVGYGIWEYQPDVPSPSHGPLYVAHGLYWAPDGHVTDLFYAVQENASVARVVAINDLGGMAAEGVVFAPTSDCHKDAIGCFGVGVQSPIRVTPVPP